MELSKVFAFFFLIVVGYLVVFLIQNSKFEKILDWSIWKILLAQQICYWMFSFSLDYDGWVFLIIQIVLGILALIFTGIALYKWKEYMYKKSLEAANKQKSKDRG